MDGVEIKPRDYVRRNPNVEWPYKDQDCDLNGNPVKGICIEVVTNAHTKTECRVLWDNGYEEWYFMDQLIIDVPKILHPSRINDAEQLSKNLDSWLNEE